MLRRSTLLACKHKPPPGKINVDTFLDSLVAHNHTAFYGVPDSLLKDLCAGITYRGRVKPRAFTHVIAANEGNAVALGVGHYLASRTVPVVYMQNSGFGNAFNPLLSLAHRAVYHIPLLLLIGWRGQPGRAADEPQHAAQGRLMAESLAAAEVPSAVLAPAATQEEATSRAITALETAKAHFAEHGTPFALLVERDTFSRFVPPVAPEPDSVDMPSAVSTSRSREALLTVAPTRERAIEIILESLPPEAAVVSTTGMPSREVYEARERRGQGHHRDFLTVGAMGHCSSIAAGIAMADYQNAPRGSARRPVIALDGDGGALMHMGAFAVHGGLAAPPCARDTTRDGPLSAFRHIVLNNGAHDSVGGQPTVGLTSLDFEGVAAAAGFTVVKCPTSVLEGRDLAQAAAARETAIAAGVAELMMTPGPAFLEVIVKKGNRPDLGRPKSTPIQNRDAMMEFLAPR